MGLLDAVIEPESTSEKRQENDSHFNAILNTLQAGTSQGNRNVALTQLAGLLRSAGLQKSVIEGLLLSVNGCRNIGLSDKEVSGIANSVSRYQPKLENRLPGESDILTVAQAAEKWKLQKELAGNCKTGFLQLDSAITSFNPGEVWTLAGRSGTLKTTFGLTLSKGIARNLQSTCLFFSLEMNAESVFFRLSNQTLSAEIGLPQSGHDTYSHLKEDPFIQNVIRQNNRLLIIDKDSLTLEQIETYLHIAREKTAIDLLLIDYLGYLNDTAPGSNYEKVSRIAKAVKGLAKRNHIRVILLCQASRDAGDGTEELKLHHLRDSGAIEESADIVLGLWHSTRTDEKRIHSELLKCRHGDRGTRMDFINSGLNLIETDYQPDPKKKVKVTV